jgi:hypothetical protein
MIMMILLSRTMFGQWDIAQCKLFIMYVDSKTFMTENIHRLNSVLKANDFGFPQYKS